MSYFFSRPGCRISDRHIDHHIHCMSSRRMELVNFNSLLGKTGKMWHLNLHNYLSLARCTSTL